MKESKVFVSVQCLVYNHATYLKQCLDSLVSQKTDFKYEVIVHDDVSTDNSAAIIKEYAKKYPDVIVPIFETESQYAKQDGSLQKLMDRASRGKYIAWCEGDDYWTDSSKLQKQVDFMEKNPDYSLCFHAITEHWDNNSEEDRIRMRVDNREYSGVEWFKKRPSQTASFFYRAEVVETELYQNILYKKTKSFPVSDLPILLCCAKIGKLRGMSDVMSVYRHHKGGWTQSAKSKEVFWEIINSQLDYDVFGAEYRTASRYFFQHNCINAFLYYLRRGEIAVEFLSSSLKVSIMGTFHAFYRVLTRRYRF